MTLDGEPVDFTRGRDDLRGRRAPPRGGPDPLLRPTPGGLRRLPALRRRGRGHRATRSPRARRKATAGMVVAHRDRRDREAPQDAARDGRVGEPRASTSIRCAATPRRSSTTLVDRYRRAPARFAGRQSGTSQPGRREPVHPARLRPLHLLLPLRAGLRRAGGRLRDQRDEPRLRHPDHHRVRQRSQGLAMHLLRPVRADLPDRRARRQARRCARRRLPGEIEKTRTDLPLLRRRLLGRHPDQGRRRSSACSRRWTARPTRARSASRDSSPSTSSSTRTGSSKPLVRSADGELHRGELGRGARPRRRRLPQGPRRTTGATRIYGVASGRAPHEAAYTMQKFIRAGFGTNHIDNCSRA